MSTFEMSERCTTRYDLLGIGLGPANLSLAALLSGKIALPIRFFDRNRQLAWHPGLMFPGVGMQTPFLEDLVSPVDPTNKLSFMSYLVSTGRIYSFMCRDMPEISRTEFEHYLSWAAAQLDCVQFSEAASDVQFADDSFVVQTNRGSYRSRAISLGVGSHPFVPPWARRLLSDRCFVAKDVFDKKHLLDGARVAVIGGGQTAADLMTALLENALGDPAELHWITRRNNLVMQDVSPFTNEFHTPQYTRYFYRLPSELKKSLLTAQRSVGDGISEDCLRTLYDAIYRRNFIEGRQDSVFIYPHCTVTDLDLKSHTYSLSLVNLEGQYSALAVDIVILCTGYERSLPPCMESLRRRIPLTSDGHYNVTANYRIEWDGPDHNPMYALNAARHSHGIADSSLTLTAWRAAVIANDVAGKGLYRTEAPDGFIRWAGATSAPEMRNCPAIKESVDSRPDAPT